MLEDKDRLALTRLIKTQEGIDYLDILKKLYTAHVNIMLSSHDDEVLVGKGRCLVLKQLITILEDADKNNS